MKTVSGILITIVSIFLSVSAFSQLPAKIKSNSQQNLHNEIDSTVTSEQLNQSKSDSGSYHIFMRFWDQRNLLQINQSLSFNFKTQSFSPEVGKLPSGSEIFKRYGNLNFQSSTAYQFSYADELYRTHVLKPDYGNAVVVPILPMAFLALYGAREGFLALQKDPLISLEDTDIKILEIIWGNPDITDVDCYQLFNQSDYDVKLTFMTMQEQLDRLVKQKIIMSRTDVENRVHYNPRYSRQELLQRLEEELSKNFKAQHLARNLEIQKMKMLLLTSDKE